MDRVKQIFQSLTPSERKALRTYLDAFHLKGENKSMEFLKLIEKFPDITQEQASQKLYEEPRSKAFIMMKGRLLEKMTEFLTLSVNPEAGRRDHDAPYHHDLIEFRKAMLYATALQERQLSSLAIDFLEKARELAARCNAPELEVDALIRLRGLDRTGTERFEALSIQIQKALVQQELDINATGLMRKYMALHSQKITSDEARAGFLQTHIPPLEEQLRQVYSPRADYFLQMLKVHEGVIVSAYDQGKAAALRATEILQQYEGMRSSIRISDTWFQLGRLEMRCERYPEAIQAFQKSRAALAPESKAHLFPSMLHCYCLLYLGDLAAARAMLEDLKTGHLSRVIHANAYASGLFAYLQSVQAFLSGHLQQSWMLLQDSYDANLGREGWLTAMRLFEVMILVDREQYDLASQKLENLRKHIARYDVPMRMRVFYKLLAGQERHSFSFEALAGEEAELERLRTELDWDSMAQEIVRYDQWYAERRQRKGGR